MNYRMLIQYDGTRYAGWQRQATTKDTIQGKIEDVLSRMIGEKVEINGAGRTDAGVHAKGQVANVHLPGARPGREIRDYLNQYLPEDICVLEVDQVSERFHSRLNAGAKTYCYRISTNSVKNVFERKYIYDLNEELDVERMRAAASLLLGEHDFQSFCARKMKKSTVRDLYEIRFKELPGELQITYRGSGFLYNMVRILTGTLIEVGRHERTPESVLQVLHAKERARAGYTAPAKGLCLIRVEY
jgi:tRNA pseudouridine38-40 synthase